MITYIDAKNASQYQILFDKATDQLNHHSEDWWTSESGESFENISITTLDEYFSHLEDLARLHEDHFGDHTSLEQFLRLPLDEDVFEIDANSRIITVPASFAKNGISVQGDEIAEILYFTIDRYFDATDLSTNDMNIVIQWETKERSGLSLGYGKDVVSVPGKIIFGWPISSELTAAAGSIKFAVRFYKINNGQVLTYSFSTLPAEVVIKPTLNYDILDSETQNSILNKVDTIKNRISSSGIYDASAPIPGPAILTFGLCELGTQDDESEVKVANLSAEAPHTVTLAVAAKPSTEGYLSYDLSRSAFEAGSPSGYSTSSLAMTAAGTPDYIQLTEKPEDYDNGLYIKVEGEYQRVADLNAFNDIDINETELYRKIYTYTIGQAGKYVPIVTARAGANSNVKVFEDNVVYIPGPLSPNVEILNHNVIVENGEAVLRAKVQKREALADTDLTYLGYDAEDYVDLSYKWYDETNELNGTPTVDEQDEDIKIFTVTGLTEPTLDKHYTIKATSVRNGESVESKVESETSMVRVTQAPQKPRIFYRSWVSDNSAMGGHFENIERDYQSENNFENISKNAANAKISFSVEKPVISDDMYYFWMKARVDNDIASDWESNGRTAKLQVDLHSMRKDSNDNNVVYSEFAELFGDNWVDELFPEVPGQADIPVTDDPSTEELEFGSLEDHVITLSDLGSIEASGVDISDNLPAKYTLPLSPETESGTYYCIIVNKLNGHYAANVSPFFIVS